MSEAARAGNVVEAIVSIEYIIDHAVTQKPTASSDRGTSHKDNSVTVIMYAGMDKFVEKLL